MIVGIIGLGVVGSVIDFCFKKLGHKTVIHDIKLKTTIHNVLMSDIVYICVPTKSLDDGSCDISIVSDCVKLLDEMQYDGVVAIKSTVAPGTTQNLISTLGSPKICFVPEFLRERCGVTDFVEHHDLCIIGTEDEGVFEVVKKSHGHFPKNVVQCTPTEAELCKYFVNNYNATLITFANSFYEVCKKLNVNYLNVKSACVNKSHIHDMYLDCNEEFRAFGGVCLPKDLKCIANIMKDTPVSFFDCILNENSKYNITVPEGMRLSGG